MTFFNAEKFMNLLSGSPEVKILLDREKAAEQEAQKQDRHQCLERLKTSEASQQEKKEALDAALAALEKSRRKTEEAQALVIAAELDSLQVARSISACYAELMQTHGEGVVHQVLYRVNQEILSAERHIAIFEDLKKPGYMGEDGRLVFRAVPPNLNTLQTGKRDLLKALQGLRSKAAGLALAPLAPSDIAKECAQISAKVDAQVKRFETVVRPGGVGPEQIA